VLFTAINLLVGREVTASMSVPIYWSFVGLLALVTLAVAGMAYHYVERPGIDLGKQFQRRGTRLPVPSKA
jgi:peptidoglycan/LPS O-acetylase OafA/YrhL